MFRIYFHIFSLNVELFKKLELMPILPSWLEALFDGFTEAETGRVRALSFVICHLSSAIRLSFVHRLDIALIALVGIKLSEEP